jgi:hypothetical protein
LEFKQLDVNPQGRCNHESKEGVGERPANEWQGESNSFVPLCAKAGLNHDYHSKSIHAKHLVLHRLESRGTTSVAPAPQQIRNESRLFRVGIYSSGGIWQILILRIRVACGF